MRGRSEGKGRGDWLKGRTERKAREGQNDRTRRERERERERES